MSGELFDSWRFLLSLTGSVLRERVSAAEGHVARFGALPGAVILVADPAPGRSVPRLLLSCPS